MTESFDWSVLLFQMVAEKEGRLKVSFLRFISFKCCAKRDYIFLWVLFIHFYLCPGKDY